MQLCDLPIENMLLQCSTLKRASRSLAKTGFVGRVPVQARALFSGNKDSRVWVRIWGALGGALRCAFGDLWTSSGPLWGSLGAHVGILLLVF